MGIYKYIIVTIYLLCSCVYAEETSIPKETLIQLIKAKKEAISSMKINYNSTINDNSNTVKKNNIFMSLGNNLLLKSKPSEDMNQIVDGGVFESGICNNKSGFLRYTIKSDKGKPTGFGNVLHSQGLNKFYDDGTSPMGHMMLLDSKNDLGHVVYPYDLVAFLESPDSKIKDIEDAKSKKKLLEVSIGNPAVFVAILDPENNYSVTKFTEYKINYDKTTGKAIHRKERQIVLMENFINTGNDIWMPLKIFNTIIDDSGKVSLERIYEIKEINVNSDIDEKEFTDNFFPVGTRVLDGVSGVTYIKGGEISVEDVIDKTIDSYVAKDDKNNTNGIVLTKDSAGDEKNKNSQQDVIENKNKNNVHKVSFGGRWNWIVWLLPCIIAIGAIYKIYRR